MDTDQPYHFSINPATGELIAKHLVQSSTDIEKTIEASSKAFATYKQVSVDERIKLLHNLASTLTTDRDALALLITEEVGKPITESLAEVDKCAGCATYYAQHLAQWLQPQSIDQDGVNGISHYEPLGVILGIMPFNYPFWQVYRSAIPIISAGNTYILRHTSQAQLCAQAIVNTFIKGGFERGVFTNLDVGHDGVEEVIAHQAVKGVTLTGSTKAGAAIAALAGNYIKPSVLELGGSDPFIVLADADLKAAIQGAVKGRMVNNGQSCIASKRFIIAAELYEDFLAGYKHTVSSLVIGDPLLPATQIGPLAKVDFAHNLAQMVDEAVEAGATYWGKPYQQADGAWFKPAVLTEVRANNPAFDQEFFGPVAMIFSVASDQEAIDLANNSTYGLGASVWTQDLARFDAVADQLEVGMVYHNQMMVSDYRIPFGGVKQSGYGRELAQYGLLAFTNLKTRRY